MWIWLDIIVFIAGTRVSTTFLLRWRLAGVGTMLAALGLQGAGVASVWWEGEVGHPHWESTGTMGLMALETPSSVGRVSTLPSVNNARLWNQATSTRQNHPHYSYKSLKEEHDLRLQYLTSTSVYRTLNAVKGTWISYWSGYYARKEQNIFPDSTRKVLCFHRLS